jgi:hypothetical protein
VKTGRATLRELRLGPIVMKDQRTIVMPNHDDRHVFGTFDFAGLIGRELMDAYVIRIDYRRRQLAFFDKSYNYDGNGDALTCDPNFNIPVVDGKIDGQPARLGLDTGARTSIVLYAGFIAEHHVRERYQPKYSGITGWGIGGPIRTDLARIGSVTLGHSEIASPVARFTLMKTGLTAGNTLSAIVGPGILHRFVVYLDLPRDRVILEPTSDLSKPDVYDRSGMWIGQKDSDAFVVLDVMSASPAAAAGFAVGDEIVQVGDVSARKLLLPEVRERFRTEPDGTVIFMKTHRDGKSVDRRLVLRDFLNGRLSV